MIRTDEQHVLAFRLKRHGLTGDSTRTPAEIAASVVGIQAQFMLQGLVCFGPPRGQEITYVRTGAWLDQAFSQCGQNGLDEEETAHALGTLVRKYLRTFGPATLQDFAYWSGLTVAEAQVAAGYLGKGLVEVEWDGRKGLICEEDVPVLQMPPEGEFDDLVLLPEFDVYLAGHRDKGQMVAPSRYKEVFRKAGWVSAGVLQGGKVTGVWAHKRSGSRLFVTVSMFDEGGPKIREAVACRCESLARFLGCSVADVRFGDPGPA